MNNLIDRIITSLIAAAVLFIAVPDAMAADPHMPVKKVLTATDTIADAPDAVEIQLGEADVAAVLPDSIAELLDESPYDRWIPRNRIQSGPDTSSVDGRTVPRSGTAI